MKTTRIKSSKLILTLIMIAIIISLTGCAAIRDKIKVMKGELVGGVHFEITAYDHYANKILALNGKR